MNLDEMTMNGSFACARGAECGVRMEHTCQDCTSSARGRLMNAAAARFNASRHWCNVCRYWYGTPPKRGHESSALTRVCSAHNGSDVALASRAGGSWISLSSWCSYSCSRVRGEGRLY